MLLHVGIEPRTIKKYRVQGLDRLSYFDDNNQSTCTSNSRSLNYGGPMQPLDFWTCVKHCKEVSIEHE